MDEHHDTGTGWPEPPAPPAAPAPPPESEPAAVVPRPAAESEPESEPEVAAESEPEAAEEPEPDAGPPAAPARDWDVDGSAADEAGAQPDRPVPAAGQRRVSVAGALIGLLLVLFGFAFVVQLRSNSTDEQLSAARPEDLVRILSDLDARKDRLSQEIDQLRNTQQQLTAGSQGRAAALDAAAKRARDLGILAGTLPAQGPGIQVRFVPASRQGLKASVLLDAVEELRDAGAEAMEIDGSNGTSVRIVASSWFVDGADNTLDVDGQALVAPYWLTAIGDPPTMQTALNIPGGVVDTVHQAGGNVIVDQPGTVRVGALHQAGSPRYARPAS